MPPYISIGESQLGNGMKQARFNAQAITVSKTESNQRAPESSWPFRADPA